MIVKVHEHIAGATEAALFHHNVGHVYGRCEMDSLIGQPTNLYDEPVTP